MPHSESRAKSRIAAGRGQADSCRTLPISGCRCQAATVARSTRHKPTILRGCEWTRRAQAGKLSHDIRANPWKEPFLSLAVLPLRPLSRLAAFVAILLSLAVLAPAGRAQTVSPYVQALAEAVADDPALAAFYRDRAYDALWTGSDDAARRGALLDTLSRAGDHGLPTGRYDAAGLRAGFAGATSEADRGRLEARASKAFLAYADDVQSGVIGAPERIDAAMAVVPPRRDRLAQITAFSRAEPARYLRALPPDTADYTGLMREKLALERVIGAGGWGPTVPGEKLEPGQGGAPVIALRNRLHRMGYLPATASAVYDGALQRAVQTLQQDHGLAPDGVAGPATLRAINVSAQQRLQSVIAGMERARWLNRPLGARHVLVNISDFTVRVMDGDRETFVTRVIVGETRRSHQTPEFSDMMTHMIVNPTWNVPRSIAVKEYLPMLQRNPNAASHLALYNARGQRISRGGVDFTAYNANTFPFALKEPPSDGNALGLVKFMFPNPYNVYLHDTPTKNLFARSQRTFSHGCVRVQQPFELAHVLLAPQSGNPEAAFNAALQTGRETTITLAQPVPVHLTYRTAWADSRGRIQYRADVYGRDAKLFDALARQGVALRAAQG
ncbi:MAG TPA: murein L,D-transpeptidase [Rhodobacteraceae bacterium]|jgi:murein L,D-transpeptidase YcbB/YkuD|nr:L,D-transpeptidase family protein [Paracoccaceae bacterium]HBG98482.1 murein L,D-transpeptidase [Paracoccaceae bacterium]